MTSVNDTAIPSLSWEDRVALSMRTVSLVTYSVVFIVGTLGNGLVIYVTAFRMKKTVNSVWFLNLATADFIFTAFLVFTIVSASHGDQWPFGHFMCKLNNFVSVVSMFTSIFLLMAISLDRCLCIWVVVWAQNKRTARKAQLAAAAIWLCALLCAAPYAAFRDLVSHKGANFCSYPRGTPISTLYAFRFVAGFLVPFLVICVSCAAICVRARRLQRKRRSHRVILSVVLAFFVCWLPYHVVSVFDLRARTGPHLRAVLPIVRTLAVCLAFTNSCLNPFLYVFMCDEFQRKLKRSVCFVLESALAEDLLSSRTASSQVRRKSESSVPDERKDTATSLNFAGSQMLNIEEEIQLRPE